MRKYDSTEAKFASDITVVPIAIDNAGSIKKKIKDIGDNMRTSLDKAMEQGESIADLYVMTEKLERSSEIFRAKTAEVSTELKRQENRYDYSIFIGASIIILLLVYLVFQYGSAIVGSLKTMASNQ